MSHEKRKSAKIPVKRKADESREKPKVAPKKTRKPPRQLRIKAGQPALNPRSGEPVDEEELYQALVEGMGRIGRAADIIGCHRATVARAIDRIPRLQEAIAEGERIYTEKLEQFTEDCAALDEDPRRDTLRMFMLKKRKAAVYGDKQDDSSQVLQDALAFVLDKSKNPAEYKPK